MASIAELAVRISADMKDFESKMSGMQGNLKQLGENVTKVGKGMSTYITAPAIAAGVAIFALATKTGEYADRILDLNAITGMSTDTIQEWQHVAKIAGVNTEAVTAATEGLVRKLPQLQAEGGRVTEQLGKLGFSFADLEKMAPDKMMDEMITALANMDDPLERNAIGASLFGGAWKDLAPILAMGTDGIDEAKKQAHELGGVMSGEALNDANEFRVSMEKLKTAFSGIGREIASKFIPILKDDIIPAVKEHVIPLLREFADKIGDLVDWFKDLSPEGQKLAGIIAIIAVAAGPVLMVIGALIGAIAAIISPIGLVVVAVVLLGLAWVKWGGDIKKAVGSAIDYAKGKLNDFIDFVNRVIEKLNKIPGVNIGTIGKIAVGGTPQKTTSITGGGGGHYQEFAEGGIVPGPIGARRVILAHGGETILPTHKAGYQSVTNSSQVINYEGIFKGAIINVRSDNDIKQIARELYSLGQGRSRGKGAMA